MSSATSNTSPERASFFNPYRRFHGSFIPEQVSRMRCLSMGAKVIYGRLCRYAGKDGKAYPSMRALALEIGASESQARQYVRQLQDAALIHVQAVPGRSNRYRFLYHDVFRKAAEIENEGTVPRPGRASGSASTTPPESNHPPLPNPGAEESQRRGSSEENQLRESSPERLQNHRVTEEWIDEGDRYAAFRKLTAS